MANLQSGHEGKELMAMYWTSRTESHFYLLLSFDIE